MSSSNAIIPFQGRPTTVVQDIMKQIVTKISREKYDNNNINLMIWLYDSDTKNEALLYDWVLERLREAHKKDDEAGKGKQMYLREECRLLLSNVNKDN